MPLNTRPLSVKIVEPRARPRFELNSEPTEQYRTATSQDFAWRRLLGAKRYTEIAEALDAMVHEADKAELENADLPAYQLGVPVEHEPPPEIGRNALIGERDRLYQQIQQIKEAGDG